MGKTRLFLLCVTLVLSFGASIAAAPDSIVGMGEAAEYLSEFEFYDSEPMEIAHRNWPRFVLPGFNRQVNLMFSLVIMMGLMLLSAHIWVYRGLGYQKDIVRRVKTPQKIVAITFDDGPSPIYTQQILDILYRYQAPATFFMVGKHVDEYPHLAARVVNEGHEIGNHTYHHVNVPTTSMAKLSAQFIKTNMAIYNATGRYPTYARPPRGMYDNRFRRLAGLFGVPIVLWSLSAQDWMGRNPTWRIVRRILGKVRPGDIMLFHDSGAVVRAEGARREATVKALPLIIEGLRERGYQIIPLRELMAVNDVINEDMEEFALSQVSGH